MKEHKYTKYRPEWCEHPDFESIGYCWGLAVHADKGTLDEFFKDKCALCDCSKHFDEDALKAALEEGMRAALEER